MRRLWPFVAVAGLAVAIAAAWFLLREPEQGGASASKSVDPLTEAVSLAIKGISLLQGEKGVEFWRLKAEWAGMHQQNGEIDVQEPRVRYMLGEGDKPDYLFAESKLGRITDQQRVLSMWDDVKVTRGTDHVTGPKLVYTAADRVMRFPEGADVDSQSMFGTLGELVWRMDANQIEGSGGVDLTFRAQPQAASAEAAADAETAPAVHAERSEATAKVETAKREPVLSGTASATTALVDTPNTAVVPVPILPVSASVPVLPVAPAGANTAAQKEVAKPGTAMPSANKPGTAMPSANKPGTATPSAINPDAKPGAVRAPDSSSPRKASLPQAAQKTRQKATQQTGTKQKAQAVKSQASKPSTKKANVQSTKRTAKVTTKKANVRSTKRAAKATTKKATAASQKKTKKVNTKSSSQSTLKQPKKIAGAKSSAKRSTTRTKEQ